MGCDGVGICRDERGEGTQNRYFRRRTPRRGPIGTIKWRSWKGCRLVNDWGRVLQWGESNEGNEESTAVLLA